MITLITKNTSLFPSTEYKIDSSIDGLFSWASKKEWIGLDTETSGLEFWKCEMLTIQLGDWENQFVIDLKTIPISEFVFVFEGKNFILQNAKFDLQWLWSKGITITGKIFDTYLAETVLLGGVDERRSLDVIAWKYCTYKLDKSVRGTIAWKGLTTKTIRYAADDVKVLERIMEAQLEIIKHQSLEQVLHLENEFVVICAEAEYHGLNLDKEKWLSLAVENEKALNEMETRLDNIVLSSPRLKNFVHKYVQGSLFGFEARKVNIDYQSPSQIVKVLCALGFEVTSSDEEVLSEINHDFARILLEYRSMAKFVGTYGKSFLKHVRPDGTISTNYTQIVSTGRMSSKEPNLQNIPREDNYRSPFFAKDEVLVCADYSQIELVLVIEDSGEDAWVEAQNKGYDLHSINAKMTFGSKWDISTLDDCKFTKEKLKCKCPEHGKMRDTVKTVTYASLYGAQGDKIAQTLKIPKSEGKLILKAYYQALPNLKKWMDNVAQYALHYRKIYTFKPFRRVRYFEEFESADSVYRKSVNTRIQGTAADCFKYALVLLARKRKELNLNFKFRAFVHDEVILSTPDKEKAEELKTVVRECFTKAGDLLVKKTKLDSGIVISDFWTK